MCEGAGRTGPSKWKWYFEVAVLLGKAISPDNKDNGFTQDTLFHLIKLDKVLII